MLIENSALTHMQNVSLVISHLDGVDQLWRRMVLFKIRDQRPLLLCIGSQCPSNEALDITSFTKIADQNIEIRQL